LLAASLTLSQHASFGIERHRLIEQPGQLQHQDAGSTSHIEKLTGAVQ
jgi:hypothetical protein